MTKSNTITFTVTAAPPPPPKVEIVENKISAPKTELTVGETVTVSGSLRFSAALPGDANVRIDIYVNDVLQRSDTLKVSKGSTTASYSFMLSFTSAGTYNVYTDANFA
jgi:subtilase family serine protease